MILILGCSAFLLNAATASPQQAQSGDPPDVEVPVEVEPETPVVIVPEKRRDPIEILLERAQQLHDELHAVRQDLAQARLERDDAQREAAELRQFIADHHEFGDDFEQYQEVKAIALREDRRKEAQANRQQREAEKSQRQARAAAARIDKAQRDAQAAHASKYRRMGFTPLGLDVYASKMSYFYEADDTQRTRVDYDPILGDYLRPIAPHVEIDYSQMTISGSVLNASDETRNIGVAITFFDRNGNQVGHETIQINNARSDVPYPFTSKIDMALNGPFTTSSTYVLYADAADEGMNGAMDGEQSPPPDPPAMAEPQRGAEPYGEK